MKAILIWCQPEYEPGYDYRIATDRKIAAGIVREMRAYHRRVFHDYDAKLHFTNQIRYLEIEVES